MNTVLLSRLSNLASASAGASASTPRVSPLAPCKPRYPVPWSPEEDFAPTPANVLKGRCPPPQDLAKFVEPISVRRGLSFFLDEIEFSKQTGVGGTLFRAFFQCTFNKKN